MGEVKRYNKDGGLITTYSYEKANGDITLSGIEIRTQLDSEGKPKDKKVSVRYLLREAAQSSAATYEGKGKHYEIIEVDALYGLSAIRKYGFNDFDYATEYSFDGIGGFVETNENGDAKHYTYSIIGNYDDLKMAYNIYAVAEDGKIYAGEFNMSSFNKLSLTEKDKFYNLEVYGVDRDGKVDLETRYVFDGLNTGSLTYVKGDDMATYEYKFLEEKDGVCTFEVVSSADRSKKYNGVLTYGKDGAKNTFTLEEVKA